MTVELEQKLTSYVEFIKTNYANWDTTDSEIRREMIQDFNDSIRTQSGSKYIKVIVRGSVHSFIVVKPGKFPVGTILRAASWAAPATNFGRGNVLDPVTYSDRVTWTGVI